MTRLVVAAGVVLGVAGMPPVALAAAPVVSNVFATLVQSRVAIPDSDQTVDLEGTVHLVVRVVPLEDGSRYFTVYANLPADVSAQSSTGERFVAVGAVRHADTHTGLIIPCIMPEGFTLIQASAGREGRSVAPTPFGLYVLLQISEDGAVTAAAASTDPDLVRGPR
jgi:hypothetical protein